MLLNKKNRYLNIAITIIYLTLNQSAHYAVNNSIIKHINTNFLISIKKLIHAANYRLIDVNSLQFNSIPATPNTKYML